MNTQKYLANWQTNSLLSLLCLLLLPSSHLKALDDNQGKYWNLPQLLNHNNSKISFEVDSTWHRVHFDLKQVSGKVWLANLEDFNSIKAQVHLPVKDFDSDNGSRDSKLRHVMSEDNFPEVVFNLNSLSNLCKPEQLSEGKNCEVLAQGQLQIKDVKEDISFPATISKKDEKFELQAQVIVDWSRYGVEDPSILIATVEKEVSISISVVL
jgi:polyisoprenoid-binding protein YceI